MKSGTILIFDTIRPDYFKTLFKDVEIIKEDSNTIHSSKRIVCILFLKSGLFLIISAL